VGGAARASGGGGGGDSLFLAGLRNDSEGAAAAQAALNKLSNDFATTHLYNYNNAPAAVRPPPALPPARPPAHARPNQPNPSHAASSSAARGTRPPLLPATHMHSAAHANTLPLIPLALRFENRIEVLLLA
jgi:hypothetical protein